MDDGPIGIYRAAAKAIALSNADRRPEAVRGGETVGTAVVKYTDAPLSRVLHKYHELQVDGNSVEIEEVPSLTQKQERC